MGNGGILLSDPVLKSKLTLTDTGPVQATTTVEEDRHTAGQRSINLIWESTQAIIAVTIVLANIVAAFKLSGEHIILGNAFFLVIGFYFGRTNHQKVGGVTIGR